MGDKSKGIFRLRLGIVLFILSWMPIAQALLVVAHNNGKLTSESASNSFRLIVWGIQFLIGFIGIWLAGSIAFKTAKQDGWKQTPKKLWHLFWNGPGEQEVKK